MEITEDVLNKIRRLKPRQRRLAMKEVGKLEWEKCARDIFYWLDAKRHELLGEYVFTKDPHPMYKCITCGEVSADYKMTDREKHLTLAHGLEIEGEEALRGAFIEQDTTRAFPFYLPYMRPIIEWWLREPIICLEKSRDMTATWVTVTCYTWDTIFHKGRENIFQSEDASKTLDLVERASFIYRNQPRFLRDIHPANFTVGAGKSGRLTVPSLESVLLGFPQGPDQIRQYHPSGVFQDEAAYQISAGDAFMSIKPAIQNGGRFTAVSSANPSWFYHACRDTLESLI